MRCPLGRVGLLLAALSVCTACQPGIPAPAPQPSQLPQIHTTPHSLTPQPSPREEDAAPETDETAAPFPETVVEMARLEYGERLIEWIAIPALDVLAPVIPVGWSPLEDASAPEGRAWDSPDARVGWVLSSALPGERGGNVILYGHNNIHSSVFRDLAELRSGDSITLTTGAEEWAYQVAEVNIFPVLEDGEDAAAYREYFKPSRAPRLTLVSCWPPTNNTHRVIVVAYPIL